MQVSVTNDKLVYKQTCVPFKDGVQQGTLQADGSSLIWGYWQKTDNDVGTLSNFVLAALVMLKLSSIYSQAEAKKLYCPPSFELGQGVVKKNNYESLDQHERY